MKWEVGKQKKDLVYIWILNLENHNLTLHWLIVFVYIILNGLKEGESMLHIN